MKYFTVKFSQSNNKIEGQDLGTLSPDCMANKLYCMGAGQAWDWQTLRNTKYPIASITQNSPSKKSKCFSISKAQ